MVVDAVLRLIDMAGVMVGVRIARRLLDIRDMVGIAIMVIAIILDMVITVGTAMAMADMSHGIMDDMTVKEPRRGGRGIGITSALRLRLHGSLMSHAREGAKETFRRQTDP